MRKKILVIILFICIFCCNVTLLVKADTETGEETANDLFQLYDKDTLKGLQELKQKYEQAVSDYNDIYSTVLSSELFNGMYETAENYQKSQEAEIDIKVSELMKDNQNIISSVKNNFYGEVNELVKADLAFKVNKEEIDKLLTIKDKFQLTSKQDIDYSKLDVLEQEINSLKLDYDDSVDVSVLGDVSNVKYPLSAESWVTSKYGSRLDPMNPTSIRFHSGLDLRAAMYTEVLSLFNGVITDVGYATASGNYVKVDHGNGIVSYYCHLSEAKCIVGQKVNQYDVIALSGNTGSRTTGPHLHLGLYINGNSVDPEVLFKGNEKE